jgi:serine protease Do
MESRESIRAAKVLVAAGALLVIGIVIGFIMAGDWNHTPTVIAKTASSNAVTALESPFTAIAEKTLPAVVTIETKRAVPSGSGQPFQMEGPYGDFFRRLFPDQPQMPNDPHQQMRIPSSGSGFIIDPRGDILTNNHVVRDASEITVTLGDKRKFKAKVVGADPATDVAVIKIDDGSHDFPSVPLGDSDEMRIGDWAIAIGNALGELDGTLTVGVISAKGRSNLSIVGGSPAYQNFIQTDASINFGNSGGPLLNIRGEAIGINTAINPSGSGIGFAIPINLAKGISQQLMSNGRVVRGYLGIRPQELTPELAESWNLGDTKGVVVGDVSSDTPASRAGLRVKDVITNFDGKQVSDVEQFRLLVADTPVNKKVDVQVLRSGKPREIAVTLGERPSDEQLRQQQQTTPSPTEWLGMSVAPLDGDVAEQLGIKEQGGVVVVSVVPGSPADDSGLDRGDVIKEVNDRPIQDVSDFNAAIKAARSKNAAKPVVFLVKRGDATQFVAVTPGE